MAAQLIDGKAIATEIRGEIRDQISAHIESGGQRPGLAVVQVGADPASSIYVRNKRQACEQVGIESFNYDFPDTTTQDELLNLIDELNANDAVHGILVQLPLPAHIEDNAVIERISAAKDVDGFHPFTIGRLSQRIPSLRPCTPFGVMMLMERIGVSAKGKHAVVVGASNHVGRPLAMELLLAGATVTVCHRFTDDLQKHVADADILAVAVGKPELVPGEWVKEGAVVFDVGINRLESGKLVGDVGFEAASKRAAWITPVPGGVGPMTVTMLMHNTLQAAKAGSKLLENRTELPVE